MVTVRFYSVRARVRAGEKMLGTKEGVRLLEGNLGRRKCRYDSQLFAYRVDAGGIQLVLGLPHPERLKKIMHRIRILTTTEYNRTSGVVGVVRWERGFEVEELEPEELRQAVRRVGRPRNPLVALDEPPPGGRRGPDRPEQGKRGP